MADLRDALEHESASFSLTLGALERMFERRRRKQRRERVGAAAVALTIAAASVLAIVSLRDLGDRSNMPVHRPSSRPSPATPLEGTWQTARLSERGLVRSFVAAGGSATEGRAFFAQLGGGATSYAVITLRFDNGAFLEFESGDGNAPISGYEAQYRVSDGTLTIASPRCTGTYSFDAAGRRLRLHVIRQCARHDGVYNSTLFAGFGYHRQG